MNGMDEWVPYRTGGGGAGKGAGAAALSSRGRVAQAASRAPAKLTSGRPATPTGEPQVRTG